VESRYARSEFVDEEAEGGLDGTFTGSFGIATVSDVAITGGGMATARVATTIPA